MTGRRQPVAIVSGGSSGIGLAIVEQLLAEGWRVGFFSQQAQRVAEVHRVLADRHGEARIHAATADLRDPAAVFEFAAEVRTRLGAATALVCNAGFSPKRPGGRTPLAEIPLSEWNGVLAVNLTGALVCCQAVLPGMVSQNYGRIVLIGSVAGRTMPRIASASYAASKSALVGVMRSIVSEYSLCGITANTICPGRIVTALTGDAASPENQAVLTRIPIARLGRPEDIARTAAFLVADEADFINGAIIDVNGGEFMAP